MCKLVVCAQPMFFFCLQGVTLIGPSQCFLKHWTLPQNKKWRDTYFTMAHLYRLWKFTFEKNYGIKHGAIGNILGNMWENSLWSCGNIMRTPKSKNIEPAPLTWSLPPSILCIREGSIFRLLPLGVSHVPKILTVGQWNGSFWQMKLWAQPFTNRSTNKYSQFIMGLIFVSQYFLRVPNVFLTKLPYI